MRIPEQVRQRVDVGNDRILSVDEISRRVHGSLVDVLNNDQPVFTSRINRWRLPHKRGFGTPAYMFSDYVTDRVKCLFV